jgi:hypothetical protein
VHKQYLDENSRDDDVAIRDALEWCVLDGPFEPATRNASELGKTSAGANMLPTVTYHVDFIQV